MLCWNAMQAPGLAQARRKSRGSEMPRNWFCMKTQHWVLPLNFGKINGEGKTFTSRKWGRAWHLDKRHLQALLRTLFSSPLSLLHFRLQAKHVPELCNTDQRWPGLLPALPKSPSLFSDGNEENQNTFLSQGENLLLRSTELCWSSKR